MSQGVKAFFFNASCPTLSTVVGSGDRLAALIYTMSELEAANSANRELWSGNKLRHAGKRYVIVCALRGLCAPKREVALIG